MIQFSLVWQLLAPGAEYDGLKRSCEKMWSSFSDKRQALIYKTIKDKKCRGDFVDFNPYYALQKNANPQPEFLNGWQQDDAHEEGIPLVIVRYDRKYLCCTRETMETHELEYVRDQLPPQLLDL